MDIQEIMQRKLHLVIPTKMVTLTVRLMTVVWKTQEIFPGYNLKQKLYQQGSYFS